MSEIRGLMVPRGFVRGRGRGGPPPCLPPRQTSEPKLAEYAPEEPKSTGLLPFEVEFKPTLEAPSTPLRDYDEFAKFKSQFMTSSLEEPTEIPVVQFDDPDVTELEKKIIRQMEFYFGDYNLPRDKFMLEVIDHENGWMNLSVMLTFPRLAALSTDPFVVMTAIEKSPNKIIEVDRTFEDPESGVVGRVRRNPSKPVPEFSEARQKFVEERTVFVAGFPRDRITLDDILEFFESNYEQVGNVRMRYKRRVCDDDGDASEFLGSVFVSFYTKEAAERFVRDSRDGLKFFGKRLFVKWQSDFVIEKPEFSDCFAPHLLERTVFVSGFDKADTTQDDLESFFCQFDGSESVEKRNFRERRGEPWKFTGAVFLTFEDSDKAEQFLALPEVTYNGDALTRKWLLEFFEGRGLFGREIKNWKKKNDA